MLYFTCTMRENSQVRDMSNMEKSDKCPHCRNCFHAKKVAVNRFDCSFHEVKILEDGTCTLFLSNAQANDRLKKDQRDAEASKKYFERQEEKRGEAALNMAFGDGLRIEKSRALNNATKHGFSYGLVAAIIASFPLAFIYISIDNPIPRIGIVFIGAIIAVFWGANKYFYRRTVSNQISEYIEKRKLQGDDLSHVDMNMVNMDVSNMVDDFMDASRGKTSAREHYKTNSSTGICPHCNILNDPRDMYCKKCNQSLRG